MKPDCPRCGLSEGWDGVECTVCHYKPRTPSVYVAAPSEGDRRRWISPSGLIVAAGLFLFPWVEIRCESALGSHTLMGQSGFQTMTGELSFSGMFGQLAKEAEADLNQHARIDKAVLVIPYAICIVVGVVGVISLSHRGLRASVVAFCCVAAIGLLVVQTWVTKFPIVVKTEKEMGEALEDQRHRRKGDGNKDRGRPRGPDDFGELDRDLKRTGGKVADKLSGVDIRPSYTIWFWLSFAALGLALGGAIAEFGKPREP